MAGPRMPGLGSLARSRWTKQVQTEHVSVAIQSLRCIPNEQRRQSDPHTQQARYGSGASRPSKSSACSGFSAALLTHSVRTAALSSSATPVQSSRTHSTACVPKHHKIRLRFSRCV